MRRKSGKGGPQYPAPLSEMQQMQRAAEFLLPYSLDPMISAPSIMMPWPLGFLLIKHQLQFPDPPQQRRHQGFRVRGAAEGRRRRRVGGQRLFGSGFVVVRRVGGSRGRGGGGFLVFFVNLSSFFNNFFQFFFDFCVLFVLVVCFNSFFPLLSHKRKQKMPLNHITQGKNHVILWVLI